MFFVLVLLKLINGVWSDKQNFRPSPPKLPVLGNLHQLGSLMHHSLRELSKQYGPLMLLHLGSKPTLIVSSAEMAREIVKTHDIAFANRPFTTVAKLAMYGGTDVAFAPYGHYWRQVRKICVTQLLSVKRVQSFKFVREEEVASMIKKIYRTSAVGTPVDLSGMVLTLTNDIVSRCALGRKDGDGKKNFGELSREMMQLITAISFGDLVPWLGWMDVLTGLIRRIKRVSRELDTFFDQIIDEHEMQMKDDDSDHNKDFVDLLLHVQHNDTLDVKFTRDNMKAIILDMFVAGTDTASTAVEWAMTELVKNPNIMKKAQEEVRKVIGKKRKVDEEDIGQMKYLNLVVRETLRLHPPTALLPPRESSTATTVNGFDIPSKTTLLVNAWAIQRDSKVWHNNSEEFIPERFNDTLIDFKGLDYEYLPFGSGRRQCPGMSFGLAVVEVILANLLFWFDWELPGGANREELVMSEVFGTSVHKKKSSASYSSYQT